MENNYSRKDKNQIKKTKNTRKPARQHIKTGLSAFQKTVATVASLLSIIIASLTIMNLVGSNNDKSKDDTSSSTTTTTISREVDRGAAGAETETNDGNTAAEQGTAASSDTADSAAGQDTAADSNTDTAAQTQGAANDSQTATDSE